MCLLWQATSGVWHTGTQVQHSSCHSKHDRELWYVLPEVPKYPACMHLQQQLLQGLHNISCLTLGAFHFALARCTAAAQALHEC